MMQMVRYLQSHMNLPKSKVVTHKLHTADRTASASLASCCSKIRSRESNKLIGNHPFVFYPVSVSCFRGCCQGESILLAESYGTGYGDGGLGSTSRVSRMGNVAQQGGNGANSCVAQRSSETFLGSREVLLWLYMLSTDMR